MKIFKIYCSGSIQKGPGDTKKLCWTDRERAEVVRGADPLQVRFLNPDDPASDLDDVEALFGRDMYQVQIADAVIADARERRGIGIGIEMVVSRLMGTLLVVVAPRNTYYRMEKLVYRGGTAASYVHPHVAILADALVDDFEEAGRWLKTACHAGTQPKDKETLETAIAAYRSRLLSSDQPMLELLREIGVEAQERHFSPGNL